MKIALYDIENQVDPQLLEEAKELVRDTREYDLTEPSSGYYHLVSASPDYHVEINLEEEGIVMTKCRCAVFRKSKQCRHAVAALLVLREHVLRRKRKGSSSRREYPALGEVLKKLKAADLKTVVATYAASHAAFRAELLAQFMHLTKKKDYAGLLAEITPIDKYGRTKLNRNNIKTVRNIVAILIRQAQQLLKDNALHDVLLILQPVMQYLYRMTQRLPAFRDQFMTDLRHCTKLFEVLCHQSMAPRLQEMTIQLALDISQREGYAIPKGTAPLLRSAESFILDEKRRKEAFALATSMWSQDPDAYQVWGCLVVRWMRLWSMPQTFPHLKSILAHFRPEIILELSRTEDPEDVLFALSLLDRKGQDDTLLKAALHAGMRAAKQVHAFSQLEDITFETSLTFQDPDAWDILAGLHPEKAFRVLETVRSLTSPGTSPETDDFLLRGWAALGRTTLLLELLTAIGDVEWLARYDQTLLPLHREEVEDMYAQWIHHFRETYGGHIARQKLSNIFAHLKSNTLWPAVTGKIKNMESNMQDNSAHVKGGIKGFVFDLDGVIVDTAVHHFQSWKIILKQLGADITEADDLHTRGASRMESLEYLIRQYGITLTQEEKEAWAARKNEIYLEAIEQITPGDLLPGALAFLTASREAGLRLALGSASKNARGVLKKLMIEDRFDAILDGHDAVESKPHPEIFIKACQALDLDPATVVVFEDAVKGVQAALSAGCKVVGIGEPTDLREANLVISGLDQSTPAQIIEQLS